MLNGIGVMTCDPPTAPGHTSACVLKPQRTVPTRARTPVKTPESSSTALATLTDLFLSSGK